MKPKFSPPTLAKHGFASLAVSTLLLVIASDAAEYYWDPNGATAGFPSANSTTWSSTGTGNFWSTDSTGSSAVVPDYTTTTADDLFFGTATLTQSGTVTISGVVNANSILTTSVTLGGTTPTINFPAAGTFTRATDNGSFTAGTTFTGLGTSLTWRPRRNLNVTNVTHSAGSVILQTAPNSPYPYPGRTVMDSAADLGAANAPVVFDRGTIRMLTGFPYASLSAMDAEHPITFTAGKDFGLEMVNANFTAFTIDQSVDLGTGKFWPEGTLPIILTQPNQWGGVYITSTLQVSDAAQLGPDNASTEVRFGSGTTDLNGGTLIITGTSMTDLGDRTFLTTPEKVVGFTIDDAAHTFTLAAPLEQGGSTLTKSGAGTLVLSGATNTYTGATSVNAGTLRLVGGSHASPITVSSGASLGFTIGSATTSSSTVNLANGSVTLSNPGAVDGSSDYLLMTASGGFTVTDLAAQLGTAVTGYTLELQNSDTELWLVPVPPSGGYDSWAASFPGFSDPTETLDFDGGGLDSGIEFVVGGDPTDASDDLANAPIISEDGTNLSFTFRRDQQSIDVGATVSIEVGTTLASWPDVYTVGADTAGSTAGVTVTKDSPTAGFDTVTLSVPMAPDLKKFARLNVTYDD